METIVDIIAISPDSGWAFVTDEGKLYLFRPPYIPSHRIEAKDMDVEKAFQLQIFVDCQYSFKNMDEAIRFLENYYIELLENIGITEPSIDELKEFLKYVDDDTLLDYLKRAKDELIPNGDLVTAGTIVADIIELDKANAEINKMAANVLREIQKKREETKGSVLDKVSYKQSYDRQTKFPNVNDKYSRKEMEEFSWQISQEGQLFEVAA
jgi:arsenate reductase-like glutaredoxin family protein